jgi:hypothetical protein
MWWGLKPVAGQTDWRRGKRVYQLNQLDNVQQRRHDMIVLGIILIVVGYLVPLPILITIGGILVLVGVVLFILGAVGRPVGGRRVWF